MPTFLLEIGGVGLGGRRLSSTAPEGVGVVAVGHEVVGLNPARPTTS